MITKNQEVEIVGMGAKNLKTIVTGIGTFSGVMIVLSIL